jgi:uroporphyrinogen-III synthase
MESNRLKRERNVIILKSNDNASQNISKDRYADYLNEHLDKQLNCRIEHVNLLKFTFINESELKKKLLGLSHYKCLILTSKQTIEAMENILKCEEFKRFTNSTPISSQVDLTDTNKVLFQNKLIVYCVGEATSNRFKQLKQKTNLFDDCLIRVCTGGKQNAIELSKLIADDFEEINANMDAVQFKKYALYPCSSIRKDDLSIELTKYNVSFDELHVYDTIPCEHAVFELKSLIAECFKTSSVVFLVFFSPSVCQAVFDDLELNSKLVGAHESAINSFRFLSIGPSTTAKLKTYIQSDQLSLIHQLSEPSPEALLQSLLQLISE